MGKENIEQYSAWYALLKLIANFWHNKFFYRKVIVLGKENINQEDHLIFAPNHQNALMDALAVLFTLKGQPVFLARADIFRRKFIASVLYFLKILPVYRIRDGFNNLKSNDRIFNKTVDVLKNKNGLIILPEGDQETIRRLRQLKKGICRIAFQAEEASGFNLDIKIIPVGIEFTHYSRIRQVLTVVYGPPIILSEYYDLYRENSRMALNKLRERLFTEMKKIMVHIDSVEDYEAIDELRNIVNGRYNDDIEYPKLFRDRRLISRINKLRTISADNYKKICNLCIRIREKAKDLKTSYRLLEKKKHSFTGMLGGILTLIVTFPLFLYGLVFNYIFYFIPNLFLKRVHDEHFHGSVNYTITLFLAILLMPLYFFLSLAIIRPWWLAFGIFLTIPVSGIFAWNYYLLFNRISGGLKIRNYLRKKNKDYISLKNDHDELMKLVLLLDEL